jgi:hypothetical protein
LGSTWEAVADPWRPSASLLLAAHRIKAKRALFNEIA